MTDTTAPVPAPHTEDPHPTACENCATPLQGQFCHGCGQAAHNPLRSFGHALEEVFESFWHLDGRVFRTLRDLLVPGRVPANYLAGHRVGYIPPLRLFMVLTLLAFFVGKLMLHTIPTIDVSKVPAIIAQDDGIDAAYSRAITEAGTAAKVDAALAEAEAKVRADIATARGDHKDTERLQKLQKDLRDLAELRKLTLSVSAKPAASEDPKATPAETANRHAPGSGAVVFSDADGKDWNPQQTPIQIGWLPQFANRWLNARATHVRENMHELAEKRDPKTLSRLVFAGIAAIPTALFLLLPVFALLLKLVYINRHSSYLEHLVVALYSHAWLMLAMLGILLLAALGSVTTAPLAATLLAGLGGVLWLWIPVYLFLTQRRVYGGSGASVLLRYLLIGTLYFVLVTFVAVYAVMAGLSA